MVVFDTNVLLQDPSDNGFLACVCRDPAPHLLAAIPWVVLEELDGLKSASDPDLARRAREALRSLETQLKTSPKIQGQRRDQVASTLLALSNDDQILDYCRWIAATATPYCVLATNDRNLSVKALVHRMLTLSTLQDGCKTGPEFVAALRSLTPAAFSVHELQSLPKPASTASESLQMEIDQDPAPDSTMAVDMSGVLATLVGVYQGSLGRCMEKILLEKNGLIPPPPWLFQDMFLLLDKEFGKSFDVQTCFPPYFSKSRLAPLISVARDITRSQRQESCTFTKGDLIEFIKSSRDLVFAVCDAADETALRKQTQSLLQELVRTIESS
ncbi:hypothetical protein HDV03_000742 [Kappamyces sp. JEL0829]|nr:hypothetical protein HDV03_000742 [Kappamyces sp. JEL0829]